MGEVDVSASQNKLAVEVTEKLLASDKKVEELTETVKNQKKTITDTAELLRDLMVNIENLGENVQNFQREVENWRSPEIQEAEMELENLMKEPEVNTAKARPSNTPQENPALRPNTPDSLLDETQEKDVQKRFHNLRNLSEFSPEFTPLVSAEVQSTSPVFNFG